MLFYLGSSEVSAIYLGTTPVTKFYLGSVGLVTETLPLDAVVDSTNLTGAEVANLDESVDSPDANWATATDTLEATMLHARWDGVDGALIGQQKFRARLRKPVGAPDADVSVKLFQLLVEQADLGDAVVSSTTGAVVEGTWTPSDLDRSYDQFPELKITSSPVAIYALPSVTSKSADSGNSNVTFGARTMAYQTGILAGERLIVAINVRATDGTCTVPTDAAVTDYVAIGTNPHDSSTAASRLFLFEKTAAGTESGTSISFTVGGTTPAGRMYIVTIFRLSAGGAIEDVTNAPFAAGAITAPELTSTVQNSLAIAISSWGANASVGDFTGETGGDWSEAVAQSGSSQGDDATTQIQTSQMVTPGTISGGTVTPSVTAEGICVGFVMRPAVTTGAPVEVASVEWAARYRTGSPSFPFDKFLDDTKAGNGSSPAAAYAAASSLTAANNLRVGVKRGDSAVGGKSFATFTGFSLKPYGHGYPDVPVGFAWTPDFTVGYDATGANYDTPFLPTATYYVDKATGNDTTGTGAEGAPWKTLSKAFTQSDTNNVDALIYLKTGRYYGDEALPADGRTPANQHVAIVPWGAGRPILIGGPAPSTLTWADETGGIYSTTVTSCHIVIDLSQTDEDLIAAANPGLSTAQLIDFGWLNSDGSGLMPMPLTKRADLAALQAAADGFAVVSNTVYVKCGRVPDSDIQPLTNRQGMVNFYSPMFQIKECDIFGFAIPLSLTRATSAKSALCTMVVDDCRIGFGSGDQLVIGSGLATDAYTYVRDTIVAYSSTDCINLAETRFYTVEERCKAYAANYNVAAGGTSQASTAHNTSKVIRVGGLYSGAGAQAVADVSASHAWIINCRGHNTDGGDVFTSSGANTKMWVDTAVATGGSISLNAQTSGELNYRAVLYDGVLMSANAY